MANGRGFASAASSPLAMFPFSAPAIGQLLYLALSRGRAFDADALALDLIETAVVRRRASHAGNLVRFVLLPGQRHDGVGAMPLIADVGFAGSSPTRRSTVTPSAPSWTSETRSPLSL